MLCQNKAQQPCSSLYLLPRCKWNKRQQVQVETYKPVSSQQPNDHRTVSPLLYSPPPSQLTSTEPRTGSGRPTLQPPASQGGANQKTPTSPSSTAHKQQGVGDHNHLAYQTQMAPIPAVPPRALGDTPHNPAIPLKKDGTSTVSVDII